MLKFSRALFRFWLVYYSHENPQMTSMDDLLNSLNERSERSKVTQLWSDILINGCLSIMTDFVRGANEQDFPL